MAIIDHDQGVVSRRQSGDAAEVGYVAVHGKDAVCHDEDLPGAATTRGFQLDLQVVEIVGPVSEPGGLAEAHPVDDGSVVQAVGDDRVGLVEQGLEHPAVGVEGRREEDRVLVSKVIRDRSLERLVQLVGPADEAHRRQAGPGLFGRASGGQGHPRVRGQAQIVVGAEVDRLDVPPGGSHRDQGPLRGRQHPFGLREPLSVDVGQGLLHPAIEFGVAHGVSR